MEAAAKFGAKQIAGRSDYGKKLMVKFDKSPYYDQVLDDKGKLVKREKVYPSYISPQDVVILIKVRDKAYRYDCKNSFCGIRYGKSGVWSLIPEVGDLVDVSLSLSIVWACRKLQGGLSLPLLLHMLFNIGLEGAVGAVPYIGGLADVLFKANTRNVKALEKHLRKKYDPTRVNGKTQATNPRSVQSDKLSLAHSNYHEIPRPATRRVQIDKNLPVPPPKSNDGLRLMGFKLKQSSPV